MRTAGALKYLSLILSGLLLVLLVLVFNLDFGRFRPQAEALLSSFLGRDLGITGPLHLTLDVDGRLDIIASGIHLSGADWSSIPELAQLDKLELGIDLWSTFTDGPVLIESLTASGLQLHLDADAEGRNNWTLAGSDLEDEDGDGERFALPVFPRHVRVEDVLVTYRSPGLARPLTISLAALNETIHGDDKLSLAGDGSINGEPLQFALTSPQAGKLVDLRDVKAKLNGHLGDISVAADVDVDDLLRPARPTANIDLSGPSVEYLLNLLHIEPLTSGPLRLAGRIAPAGEYIGLQLNGAFGEFIIAANGQFSNLQTLETFSIESSVEGPDLGHVAAFLGIDYVLPPDPFTFHALIKRSGSDISVAEWALRIDQATLSAQARFHDFPDPNGARGSLQLDIPELERFAGLLQIPGEVQGPLLAALTINPGEGSGGAQVEGTASHGGMALDLVGEVGKKRDHFVGSTLQVNLRGPTTAVLAQALGLQELPAQPFAAQLNATRTTTGATVEKSWVVVGDNRFDLDGTIGDSPLLSNTALSIELAGPTIVPILRPLLGPGRQFSEAPYRLRGRVKTLDGRLLLNDLVATLGEERLALTGAIAREPFSPGTELEIKASSPDLRRGLAGLGLAVAQLPEGELAASAVLRGAEGLFNLEDMLVEYAGVTAKISGVITNAEKMNGSSLALDLGGTNLARLIPSAETLAGLARPFTLTARLLVDGDFLQIDGADFRIDKTRLQADSRLALGPPLATGSFSLVGNSPDILPLAPRVSPGINADRLPFKLRGQGVWDRKSLTLKGFELMLARSEIEVDGTLENPPNFDETNLVMSGRLPDLSRFSQLVGRELPGLPLALNFSLSGKGNEVRMKNFNATLGESDLGGDFSFRYGEIPQLQGIFRSTFFDITPLLPPPRDAKPAQVPNQSPATPFGSRPRRERLIPDAAIPMARLQAIDAAIDVEIKQLRIDAQAAHNLKLVGSVADGTLTVQRLEFDGERGGRLRAGASLRPVTSGGALGIRVSGDALSLGLPAITEDEVSKLPQYDLDLALVAKGATLRELAAGSNGYLKLKAGKGRYKTNRMRLLTNDFIAQLAATLNPFAKEDPYMKIRCAAVLAAIEDGKLSGKPVFVMSSDRLNIFANADIDLATEKLNLTFDTVPQKGLGIGLSNLVNPYIMVAGTLANPVLSLDPESTLIQGGAAVATGGLSILAKGLKDRYLSSKNPCRSATREADEYIRVLEEKYNEKAALR